MSTRHGPLMLLRLGSVPTLVVSSAAASGEVMRARDLAFCSRHLSATAAAISRGGRDIVFSPYGARWRDLRKVCVLELFSHRRVLSFRPVREDEVARLLRSVSGECAGGAAVDLGEAIGCTVNDVIVRMVVGARCRLRDEFLRELDAAVRLTGGFSLVDLYPSSRLVRWFSAAARDIARCQRNMYRIIESIIHEREAKQMGDGEEDLLGVLLRLQKEGGLQFDLTNEILKHRHLLDVFAAGSETSSTVLVWAMSELTKNPRVLHKAQSEGENLHLVIKETLRLHTPLPFLLARECRETCQVMGYDVPKGVKVIVNVWAISRDNSFWDDGEDSDQKDLSIAASISKEPTLSTLHLEREGEYALGSCLGWPTWS
ncbi:hypothetical protein ACP4OV_005385 [Aristida adscensionis]